MPKNSDGPKNSQGYIRVPAHAGMTNEPYFVQLLKYTDDEFTAEVARAWLRDAPQWAVRYVLEHFDDPALEPALREVIVARLKSLGYL